MQSNKKRRKPSLAMAWVLLVLVVLDFGINLVDLMVGGGFSPVWLTLPILIVAAVVNFIRATAPASPQE